MRYKEFTVCIPLKYDPIIQPMHSNQASGRFGTKAVPVQMDAIVALLLYIIIFICEQAFFEGYSLMLSN